MTSMKILNQPKMSLNGGFRAYQHYQKSTSSSRPTGLVIANLHIPSAGSMRRPGYLHVCSMLEGQKNLV